MALFTLTEVPELKGNATLTAFIGYLTQTKLGLLLEHTFFESHNTNLGEYRTTYVLCLDHIHGDDDYHVECYLVADSLGKIIALFTRVFINGTLSAESNFFATLDFNCSIDITETLELASKFELVESPTICVNCGNYATDCSGPDHKSLH